MPWPRLSPRLSILALTTALCLAACGSAASPGQSTPPAGSPSPSGIAHGAGASDLVLRYEIVGGFVAPQALITRYPTLSIYGDGTVITEGPQPAIFPGPALPNLIVSHVSEAGLQRLLELARDAGLLGPDASFDAVNIADAGTAQFTTIAEGKTHVISALGLSESPDEGPGLDPTVIQARSKLRAFLARIGDLKGTLGSDYGGTETSYPVTKARVVVTPGAPQAGDIGPQPTIVWPLATKLADFGQPFAGGPETRCGTVDGDEMATLLPLLRRANGATPWVSANRQFTVVVRVLLPDESGCPTS